ncbi:hypothetical protein M3N55_16180, partial [Roseibaca sp. V10]
AHFPHRPIQDPRGFLLPRFVNVSRKLMAANVVLRPTSKNLQESGRSLRICAEPILKENADIQNVRHSAKPVACNEAGGETLHVECRRDTCPCRVRTCLN